MVVIREVRDWIQTKVDLKTLLDPNCQKKIPVKVRLYRATRVIIPTNEDTLTTILLDVFFPLLCDTP